MLHDAVKDALSDGKVAIKYGKKQDLTNILCELDEASKCGLIDDALFDISRKEAFEEERAERAQAMLSAISDW